MSNITRNKFRVLKPLWNYEINYFTGILCLQSRKKYLEPIRELQQNWAGKEKFDIYFFVFFDCYCKSLISGRETRHWAMSPLKLEKFPIFPIFLRS